MKKTKKDTFSRKFAKNETTSGKRKKNKKKINDAWKLFI